MVAAGWGWWAEVGSNSGERVGKEEGWDCGGGVGEGRGKVGRAGVLGWGWGIAGFWGWRRLGGCGRSGAGLVGGGWSNSGERVEKERGRVAGIGKEGGKVGRAGFWCLEGGWRVAVAAVRWLMGGGWEQ